MDIPFNHKFLLVDLHNRVTWRLNIFHSIPWHPMIFQLWTQLALVPVNEQWRTLADPVHFPALGAKLLDFLIIRFHSYGFVWKYSSLNSNGYQWTLLIFPTQVAICGWPKFSDKPIWAADFTWYIPQLTGCSYLVLQSVAFFGVWESDPVFHCRACFW